ncbi:MAG: Ig-like domain-containing protein [Saprospiraceae bacterium]|nr:Ig-like domain-containing protein [Candidatus Vicinibacter affinis]
MKKLFTLFAIASLALMASCKKDDFIDIKGLCPLVISTDPANGETGVARDKVITITFNEEMNPSTINSGNITITGLSQITGVLTYSGNTASFNPVQDLEPNTTYTGRVTRGVKDIRGNALQVDYVWSFSTGITLSPIVIVTDPFNNEKNVALDKVIRATFSEVMDASTFSASSFIVTDGTNQIDGVISYNGTTVSFQPATLLDPNVTYTAILTSAIKNISGTPLVNDYVWTFMTINNVSPFVISTDPANEETNVVLSKVITATFSEAMNVASINSSSFILRQGTNIISGVVSYSGVTASFTPAASLVANTTYTVTISGSVKSQKGVNMSADYVWIFSTGSILAPTVIFTDPANGETGVALNKIIRVGFSTPMNPLTITTQSFILMQGSTLIPGTISYAGTIASFTPSQALKANTVYTATIKNSVKNIVGTQMLNDYVWSFTTASNLAPIVISTDPVNNATNVPTNKVVTANFSMTMDPSSINTSSFIMMQGVNQIKGVVLYQGTTASFVPSSALKSNTLYTMTITNTVKNLAGVFMVNNYVWSFTTLTVPAPTVLSTDPFNNETGVALNKIIKATFSMPMDPSTINVNTFTFKQGVNIIPGTISYAGVTATFTPTNALLPNTVYTGTITTGVKNLSGIPMANNYVWTFTTLVSIAPNVIATDPNNGATGVALNKTITATFNMPMDPLTINGNTFTLKQGANTITGTVSYAGTTATFNPTSALLPNTIYTGTITTGAKNLAGIPIANNYVWTFTTIAGVPPTVISTDPSNNAVGVAQNKTITATFSVPMDPTTINSANFFLKQGSNLIPGSISYSGTVATFNPTNDLELNTVYTVTITNSVKDLAGTPMTNNYVWTFTTKTFINPPLVNLKSVERFGIIAGVGISNNAGISVINDLDVGISPGVRSSVTGFPPAIVVNGAIYASDDVSPPGIAALLTQAKADLTAAYNFAQGASNPPPVTISGDQGGLTLAPGIYKTTSSLQIASGDLTLDAQGDPSAVWIFQIASSLTTIGGAGGSVILAGGAQAGNIFWAVGSSATIGNSTAFQGNVLALTSITMNTGASVDGRMLCINGAVVLTGTNVINRP